MQLTTFEKKLIDGWQRGFPLEPRPYAAIADSLGVSEGKVMETLGSLKERGVLSRAGAVVQPNTAGSSTLAAMKVPPQRLEEVAGIVSAEDNVNHNYGREHELNLWFVVAAADEEHVSQTISRIEKKTGLQVISLPLEKAYHIDLGFALWNSLSA